MAPAAADAETLVAKPGLLRHRRYAAFGILVVWTLAIWVSLIGKAIVDSSTDYIQHFTNWGWTINVVYYTLDIIATICDWVQGDEDHVALSFVINTLLWTLLGTVWVIFWMVTAILAINPGMLTDSGMSLGVILVFHVWFHYLPAIFALLYVFALRPGDITRAITFLLGYDSTKLSVYKQVFIFFMLLFLLPISFALIYRAVFDPNDIYNVNIPMYAWVLATVAIVVITNGLTLWFLYTTMAAPAAVASAPPDGRKERRRKTTFAPSSIVPIPMSSRDQVVVLTHRQASHA